MMLLAQRARAACGPAVLHEHAAHAAPSAARPDPDSGDALLGTPAPEWAFTRWVRGGPLDLAKLRGKVVLVRWWTEGCHFCRSTLPQLEKLQKQYGKDGLVVVGVFHPKPEPREVSNARIVSVAKELGFSGPIAFDRDWTTLGRYWLDGHPDRNWTSVSFLIDREGTLRWVHGGGEYHHSDDPMHLRCEFEEQELEKALAAALGTKSAAAVR